MENNIIYVNNRKRKNLGKDGDDKVIQQELFTVIIILLLSGPRNNIGNLAYHHPLKFTNQNLLKLEIPLDALHVNPSTAINYRFAQPNFQQQTTWGPIEALSCLIECGANPKLIDEQWVIWKIASMVRNYPDLFHDWLSSEKVLDQLKHRYEREINCGHKSAIKLIVEDDASPPLSMVLSIMKSKIKIGCKLEICGAWVCGKHDGKAQALSVLDATSPVYLKLSGNSIKPAHWDSKLGFRKLEIFAMLKSLISDGGSVPAIDVIIMRNFYR
nr:14366_t:CDS:2 [Entrophospora candida]